MKPLRDKLEDALRSMPLGVQKVTVHDTDSGRVFAVVEAEGFASMDEGDRQAQVWEHLLSQLDEAERLRIEFVFTTAPGEDAAA